MLQPTGRAATPRIAAYAPRDRWVPWCYGLRSAWRGSDGHARKGYSINNPPLTRWVCAADPFVCRLHHHEPTSDEVGMRENLPRTLRCRAGCARHEPAAIFIERRC